ncbi:MAG: response regulator [Anaerolineaceae bacterium]|jgi:DNA-binding response OmpR family regulator|nr:response regulator [Acetobacterium sp.]MDP3450102.1 response regulator [Anaerolineaceae bacterium]
MAENITPDSVTILIVEDDTVTQKTVAILMARAGFASSFASNGVEALEKVVENPPDLIISDVMMPEMDGFTLLYALRSNPQTANIPIILLTARDSEVDIIDGINMGASDYIPKPFDPNTLLVSVKARLNLN